MRGMFILARSASLLAMIVAATLGRASAEKPLQASVLPGSPPGGDLSLQRGTTSVLPHLQAADQLPAYCGAIGAQPRDAGTPPPPGTLERGTIVTVTTDSDAVNGDTSSVRALLANPGPDGVSLREAITAINHDSGKYTIRFAPSLKGAVIKIGPRNLPRLTAAFTIINGDINGDGQPDVTLENNGVTDNGPNPPGLIISAGDITVHAIGILNYPNGILIAAVGTNQTYANITISHNRVEGSASTPGWGITLHPSLDSGAVNTQNRWVNLTIVGNSVALPLVLLCYKLREQQKGQQGSRPSRARAIRMRSVAMDCGLCRSARARRAAGLELGRNFRGA